MSVQVEHIAEDQGRDGVEKHSDTGNRTPGYRVRGDNVSHYTISDLGKYILLSSYEWITQNIARSISSYFLRLCATLDYSIHFEATPVGSRILSADLLVEYKAR